MAKVLLFSLLLNQLSKTDLYFFSSFFIVSSGNAFYAFYLLPYRVIHGDAREWSAWSKTPSLSRNIYFLFRNFITIVIHRTLLETQWCNQTITNSNAAGLRRICKRSDQPKIERLENYDARLILRRKLTRQRHDRVQTESWELQPSTAVSTL